MKPTLFLTLLLSSLMIHPAQAAQNNTFGFELDEKTVQPAQRAQVQAFLEEVAAKLPDEVKSSIGRKIKVTFTDFGSKAPLVMHCDPKEEGGSPSAAHESDYGHFIGGKYEKRGLFSKEKIELNSGFIEEILNGAEGSTKFNCGHGNFYKMVTGALIHETLHAYDMNDPLTPKEKDELESCETLETIRTDRHCQYLKQLQTKVSTRSNYLSLAGWRKGLGGLIQKNTILGRSPESYELTDPAEHFAVNGEYFLTDPEYACRRPGMQKFFAEQFKTDPFAGKRSCEQRNQVRLENGQYVVLDPKRIYQVQYLEAGPGADTASSWGHSMLRIVVCAPWRKTVGPECLKDVEQQVVVSYRANLNDIKLNPIKGMTGAYESRAFFMSMKSILNEYGDNELRDLKSYPLKLTDDQKGLLIDHLKEQFWTYRGQYYFLTNNCATETLDAIKGALPDQNEIQSNPGLIRTPHGLVDLLQNASLLDTVPATEEERKTLGYDFPSIRKQQLEQTFSKVKTLLPSKFGTMDDYVNKSTSTERAQLFKSLTASGKMTSAAAAGFLDLEIQCGSALDKNLQKRTQELVEKKDGKLDRNEIEGRLKQYMDLDKKLAPWNLLTSTARYGIPINGEIDRCKIASASDELNDLIKNIRNVTDKAFPDLADEQKQLADNEDMLTIAAGLAPAQKQTGQPQATVP